MSWQEKEHPRDPANGEFTEKWASVVSARLPGGSWDDRFAAAISGDDAIKTAPFVTNEYDESPISLASSQAFGTYEAQGFRDINYALRSDVMDIKMDVAVGSKNNGQPIIKKWPIKKVIKSMDWRFEGSALSNDVAVYRGLKTLEGLPEGDLTGAEFTDLSYASMSTDRGRADGFARRGGAVMRVLVPAGTPAVQFGYSEREILLHRGRRFRIVADHGVDKDGVKQLDVEVIA